MFKKRWVQRKKLRAVHEDDLEQFLSSLGVLDQIQEGYYSCMICDTPITIENIGAIYPKNNKINFVCDRLSCLAEISVMQEDAND